MRSHLPSDRGMGSYYTYLILLLLAWFRWLVLVRPAALLARSQGQKFSGGRGWLVAAALPDMVVAGNGRAFGGWFGCPQAAVFRQLDSQYHPPGPVGVHACRAG